MQLSERQPQVWSPLPWGFFIRVEAISPLLAVTDTSFKAGPRRIYWLVFSAAIIVAVILFGMKNPDTIPAQNDWVKVIENDAFVFYVYPGKVHGSGKAREEIWELFDLKVPSALGLSLRSRNEYDCKQHQYRVLSASGYSGPMGTGRLLWTKRPPSEWNMPLDGLLSLVCSPIQEGWM